MPRRTRQEIGGWKDEPFFPRMPASRFEINRHLSWSRSSRSPPPLAVDWHTALSQRRWPGVVTAGVPTGSNGSGLNLRCFVS
jgi:hypothetical protein